MRQLLLILLFILCITGGNASAKPEKNFALNAVITKWYDNHTAALSLTYDDGDFTSKLNRKTNKFVLQNGLSLDYEIITANFPKSSYARDILKSEFIPSGLGYFGHGHTHVPHDSLSYEDALKSFTLCYETMKSLGLKPVAYAYPNGAAKKIETRQALAASGFLCGRLHISKQMTAPYIVPDSQVVPEDWFALPTLVMQDYAFQHCDRCVSNNEQLIPYLDNTITKKAWIILTYHAIGDDKGYGFYQYEEFQKNIHEIKQRDFWVASMNAITLYLREYAQAHVEIKGIPGHKKKCQEIGITVSDGLPNDIYDQPLTILFDLPDDWINKHLTLNETGKKSIPLRFTTRKGMISLKPDEIPRQLTLLKE
jgi:hypothetical protein